jgi:glycosyltransferase involved in cell wall biosynthesis
MLRIAQVAPLYESVPPKLYGGTERVVYYLTEELVNQGHEVTLFASGDSTTSGRLIAPVSEALRLNPACEDPLAPHIVQLQDVAERAGEFDLIHFHTDYLHYPFSQRLGVPHLTTLHGRLDIPELQLVYNKFPGQPLVSISNNQRTPLPQANFVGTVYHGLPLNLFSPGKGEGGYLAFLGRISPEKGCDRAIEMAIAADLPIKIAAKIDKADIDYYESKMKHLLDHPLVEYIGEINEKEKQDFLGNALALVFPINWCEPFGMVMIEAMACGTPVVAWKMGSVPEVIEEGVTGYIVQSQEEALAAIQKVGGLPRQGVRAAFERRFTAFRMAQDYLVLYRQLIRAKRFHRHLSLFDAAPLKSGTPSTPQRFIL